MKLIDEIELELCSGAGGDGIVSWLRLKYMPKGGPAGGDGGDGGDVYIKAVKDIEILRNLAGKKNISAQKGSDGRKREKKGAKGEDLIIEVPAGSIITIDDDSFELTEPGDGKMIIRGGKGGFGNAHFKSSTNVTPKESTPGKPGICKKVKIELSIIADAGLIGYPNAGKSTLLNFISNSKAKVGNYPFTTLEPNLGVFNGFVLADIPGLIEGASNGKGLGIKFLKHIMRTKLLVHLISLENQNIAESYKAVRQELKAFGKGLDVKPEIVALSKSDLVEDNKLKEAKKVLQDIGITPVVLTVNQYDSLEHFKTVLLNKLREFEVDDK